jgi:anti-sigma B factor antagonist
MKITKDVGLDISIRQHCDVSVLDLRGSSTTNDGESELLSRYLCDLATNGKRKLLLNLENLKKVDSSGVSVIVEMYVALEGQGGELKLLNPRGLVLEVLALFRLLDVVPSFDDETEALASFCAGVGTAGKRQNKKPKADNSPLPSLDGTE